MKSHDRPTMSEVLDMLESGVDGLEIPPEPFFCGDEYAVMSMPLMQISRNYPS